MFVAVGKTEFEAGEENLVPLPNITTETLEHVVDYLNFHRDDPAVKIERPLKKDLYEIISDWDREFLERFELQGLFDIVLVRAVLWMTTCFFCFSLLHEFVSLFVFVNFWRTRAWLLFGSTTRLMVVCTTQGANYLDIKPLLRLGCAQIYSKYIRGQSPEKIRETFGLPDDLTKEDQDRIREENRWCEEA